MTEEPTVEQQAATPAVSTAPPPSRVQRWRAAVPPHVGPARTSTVVLALLFLLIGTLYLNVRPDAPPPPGTVVPAETGRTTAPTTTAPPSTPAPETTAPEPEPTTEAPATTTDEETPTEETPTEETPTDEPTETAPPSSPAPTTAPPTTTDSFPNG